MRFDVISSRSIEEPPSVKVTFANGVQDEMDLTHYRLHADSTTRCSYTGQLRGDRSSSVAVTGCLNEPGDRMEVTLISENNINKIFTVDFDGNTELIKNPFEDGRQISIAKPANHNDGGFHEQMDEVVNDELEEQIKRAQETPIPSKLKATIKFGYESGLKSALDAQGTTFDNWIADVFPHTQAHFRHSCLGTQIEFEVYKPSDYVDSYENSA